MKVEKHNWGCIEGKTVSLYQLSNDKGMEVYVTNYGVTVTSVLLPDNEQGKVNVVCGFNQFEGYFSSEFKSNAPYFGAVIGRYCATIRQGQYDEYELSRNIGEHTLHGGVSGFDKQVWGARICDDDKDTSVVHFMLFSPDGDQGFPGNVFTSVIVSLNNENELSFRYEANTDMTTPFSMTNHSYFNLSGFQENIEDHWVKIQSTAIYPLDGTGNYPDNRKNIEGTAVDLRKECRIGELHEKLGDGMEYYYLFDDEKVEQIRKVAEVCYPTKKRSLEVLTTEPGMLFYTAKYTSDKLCRESGERYGKFCAFCCETHRIPNGPNLCGAPDVFLSVEKPFESETIFRFIF
ncbi:galactose mutarotase [Bacteroides xylanisolvens]|jgi:aldose 1-epimerase|uniref:Aldose 1-epimerase n=1 Tax=Bacteroides xylanisolvens TaxID=371601 RepID=A0A7J5PVL5_9BACE|nr:aldose epimerase family protein [Bacteroides xylanisolvens]KAB6146707.1 galactose mutarotase [Bacteroides xylanisolvens]MCA4532186.1 galactose mutarotase [Bacteroides xylanisolvens]MCA4550063.1 galactose mutarotase [Bacteroides xylanisolvens]MCA4563547.1 galactose mutarotase [Bacteroides xylanisolvens]MCA4568447.1 galactose mutarotase [Bacteroides xylanisolvens]